MDCVVFAKPRRSIVDIVQAAGRALRRFPGKDCGYILLPLVVPSGVAFETFAESTAFKHIARTITALSTQDERISEQFRVVRSARRSSGKIVEILGNVPVGMKMDLERFAEAIETKIWERVGRVNWRSFAEAREFVRSLKFKVNEEWRTWSKSKARPSDIPSSPELVYKNEWVNWGDWLGTGTVATKDIIWLPFVKARDYVRNLGLRDLREWTVWARSKDRPANIPITPIKVYKAEWISWADWLESRKARGTTWRPFIEARDFVRSLGLKNGGEWLAYCQGDSRPVDIPASPEVVYNSEWAGMGDWLGTKHKRGGWRPFIEARDYVRTLGLKNVEEWRAYCQGDGRPVDIPSNAHLAYKDEWVNWGDWLGTDSNPVGQTGKPKPRRNRANVALTA